MRDFAVAFSLERWLKIQSTIATVVVLVLAFALAVLTAATQPWLAALAAGVSMLTLWVLQRIPRVGVCYDAQSLTVVGAIWSHRIPRRSIRGVDREPASPWVTWVADNQRTRVTPLTPLRGNLYGWHPPKAAEMRRRYLKHLAHWARG
jgi:hypothetical protein